MAAVAAKKKPIAKKAKVSREPTITSDVTAAVVDELPRSARGGNSRSTRFVGVMGDVREKVGAGKWVQIASFLGPGGAAQVKRAILAGKRPVDGDVDDWEYHAAKVDGAGSVLYVKLK